MVTVLYLLAVAELVAGLVLGYWMLNVPATWQVLRLDPLFFGLMQSTTRYFAAYSVVAGVIGAIFTAGFGRVIALLEQISRDIQFSRGPAPYSFKERSEPRMPTLTD